MNYQTDIDDILSTLKTSLEGSSDIASIKLEYLGRKGKINSLMSKIKEVPEKERKSYGEKVNETKLKIEEIILKAEEQGNKKKIEEENNSWSDVSVVIRKEMGSLHPITQTKWLIEDIFQRMGFQVEYPFEIDSTDNNFTFVNMPPSHPARSSWDTFFTDAGDVPIVHTSSMQNRILKNNKPPIYAVVPGRCFRNESTDSRHEHTFTQFEGIVVDKGIRFTDMIGVLKTFFSEYFERDVEVMVTPDMFPFVEPGGMIQVRWEGQSEAIKKITKGTGWLEIMGCGMIHPNVLSMGNIDPDVYSGFAFGGGIERLLLIKYGIEDIRLFEKGDLKFLRQF